MSLFIASLNSGSNGNCYYIGNSKEAVLIDAGISCRETEKRMQRLGLDMQNIKAIFVSHEHTDHTLGVAMLSKKYKLPVYITPTTLRFSSIKIEKEFCKTFTPYEAVNIGTLSIIAFKKNHDAADPHSFMVRGNGVNVGVITDIGMACNEVINCFKQCHAIFIEANYDEEMLMKGNYPAHLKKRISGGHGHLSNGEALQLFIEHRPACMSHIILSHLSKNNNRPEIAEQLFTPYKHLTKIIIASRYNETNVYEIKSNDGILADGYKLVKAQKPVQLSMFDL